MIQRRLFFRKLLPLTLLIALAWSNLAFAKVRNLSALTNAPGQLFATVINKIDEVCSLPAVDKPIYTAQLMSIAVPVQVSPNQLFDVVIKYRNTGNQPWFGSQSVCTQYPGLSTTFLGTTRQLDRASVFQAPVIFGETNWFGANRIKMKNLRVNPGEIAEFSFTAHAPEQAGLYREYFAPVVEGVAWMSENAEATFDLRVGEPVIDQQAFEFTQQIDQSINLTDPIFQGEHQIQVDLSEQKMYLKIGDNVIKTFRISSGKAKTPTPIGNYKIQFKQEVRVAGKSPHYIMPKFMQFRAGGYGIHALPSLANDRGVFWREALNHIGSPRSHGCIRLLPADAEFAYKFADVGTEVKVVW